MGLIFRCEPNPHGEDGNVLIVESANIRPVLLCSCALQEQRNVRVGSSFALFQRAARLRPMSAMPPIATESMRRSELSRRARIGPEQAQQFTWTKLRSR